MLKEVFEQKSQAMGDFYVYYTKKDTGLATFAVGTTDLSTPYIASRLKQKQRNTTTSETEVVLWSWTGDNLLKLDLSQIKKLVPLASVLKNGSQ